MKVRREDRETDKNLCFFFGAILCGSSVFTSPMQKIAEIALITLVCEAMEEKEK